MKCAIFEEHSPSCVVYFRFSGTLFPVSMIDGEYRRYAPDAMQFLETRTGQVQGHNDPIMVHNTLSSQDASTHQILDSYLK